MTEAEAPGDDPLDLWQSEMGSPSTRVAAVLRSAALARTLRRRGRPDAALAVAEGALERATGIDVVLDLRVERALALLEVGRRPDDLDEVVTGLVARSDDRWQLALAERKVPAARSAARRLHEALTLLLHRALHGSPDSPLSTDPDSFLAPVRANHLYSRLAEGVRRPAVRRARGSGSCHVVLLTARPSFFVDPLVRAAEAVAGSVQQVSLATLGSPGEGRLLAERAVRLLTGDAGVPDLPHAMPLSPICTYVVDWVDEAAVWASVRLPAAGPRLVVRLHSVEALSLSVHLVDWSRVDHIIFVSETLRRLTHAVVPASAEVPSTVVRHGVRAIPHGRKPQEAATTLGMVGWGQTVKDPLFALLALRELRVAQPGVDWRLRLIGAPLHDGVRRWERSYADAVADLMDSPELRGAVDLVGFTDDVPAALEPVGFILSTSIRESDPHGLVEGVLCGAVPVVRDWPLVAPWGGARELFPDEWVVTTPDAAAARILGVGDPPREAARAARLLLRQLDDRRSQRALRAVVRG